MSQDTTVLPEYTPQPERRTSGVVAVVATVAAVVLVAGGGVAAWQFLLAGGSRPAEVLPASTFALATLDLDPSGGQKLEAIRTLRKFPSVREDTGLQDGSDPMKAFFEEIQEHDSCTGLDYERDVEPWLGSRAAVGGVLMGDDKPAPVAALQVKDAEAARSGLEKLRRCAEAEKDDFGWSMAEGHVVLSDTTGHAEAIVAEGAEKPLSEDAGFQRWTEEVGADAVLSVYVAPEAAEIAAEATGEEVEGDALTRLLEDFDGAAAALRFADGGIELSFAGGGAKAVEGAENVSGHVGMLPADTALVLAASVPEGVFDQLAEDESATDFLAGMLGLDLPQDLEDLLGESVSLSVGGDAPESLEQLEAFDSVPVGALVHGDEDEVRAVVDKLTGAGEVPVVVESGEGRVAVASTRDYARQLVEKGALTDDPGFRDAVPDADKAEFVFYVDVDSEWRQLLDQALEDKETSANLDVVRGLGVSSWTDGDASHGLVRLSLK
ncbi:MAG TPA: DUF3352 domain-containing protein [Marmoricola sp.]|nr:DUF3352 domain-containing protein [Marmoricola sp.]